MNFEVSWKLCFKASNAARSKRVVFATDSSFVQFANVQMSWRQFNVTCRWTACLDWPNAFGESCRISETLSLLFQIIHFYFPCGVTIGKSRFETGWFQIKIFKMLRAYQRKKADMPKTGFRPEYPAQTKLLETRKSFQINSLSPIVEEVKICQL